MTLTEFYLARLDEREQVALRWAEDRRVWQVVGGRNLQYDNGSRQQVTAIDVTNRPCLWYEQIYVKGDLDGGSEHIALHDPAWALADVAAKRALVDNHESALAWSQDPNCPPDQRDTYRWIAGGLYDAIRHLVAAYSGHPDFDPSWAMS